MEGTARVASLDAEHELSVGDPSGIEPRMEGHSPARRMTLNMGPQHPSTHGVLRVVLELDGETILQCSPGDRISAYRDRETIRSPNAISR